MHVTRPPLLPPTTRSLVTRVLVTSTLVNGKGCIDVAVHPAAAWTANSSFTPINNANEYGVDSYGYLAYDLLFPNLERERLPAQSGATMLDPNGDPGQICAVSPCLRPAPHLGSERSTHSREQRVSRFSAPAPPYPDLTATAVVRDAPSIRASSRILDDARERSHG
jgi:hypothetical protein